MQAKIYILPCKNADIHEIRLLFILTWQRSIFQDNGAIRTGRNKSEMAVVVLSEKAWKRTKSGYLKGKLIRGNIKGSKIGSNFYYLYSLQANYRITYKTVCSCNG